MRIKSSIKLRIYASFLLLGFLFVTNAFFTVFILNKSERMTDHMKQVVDPSLKKLDDFHDMLLQSKMLSTNWVFLRYSEKDKVALSYIHTNGYANLKSQLQRLSFQWKSKQNRDSLRQLFKGFESLMAEEKQIMNALQKFSDYDDPVLKLTAEGVVENVVLPQTETLNNALLNIVTEERKLRLAEEEKLAKAFRLFWGAVVFLAFTMVVIGLILSRYLTSIIVKPVRQIRKIIYDLGRGVTNKIEHPDKTNEIGEMVHAVNQLSDKLRYTAEFAQKTGERKFDEPFQPLSEDDTLGKALVMMRDNLRSVDESLNLAQHIAKLGSFEYNIDTGKTFCSDELYRIFELAPSSITSPIHASFFECFFPDDREAIRQLALNSLQSGEPFQLECRIMCKSGIVKTLFFHANLAKNESGQVIKFYGIVQDITERKKAEQQLETRNNELQLKNKELEQFAYVTSHDLQEPLRTISSFVDQFQKIYKDSLDERGQKFLHYIVQATDRMRTLIKDLLDYSRIGRKKSLAPVDCNEVMNMVLADLHIAIKESGAEIKTGELPVIRGYTTELKQLFQNLIINAIKFRKKEVHPEIEIVSQQVRSGYEFMIKDNGIGIPEEHNERIFVIFQRLHTRTEYEGSGIGLSHCKKIVELHGGRIWVKSNPGEGSTFHFTILENNN
jgi:signal transduction histidine kinase